MDKILFIIPPNINYDDFVNPPDNVKTMQKSSSRYGAVITDIPLGILSLSAYVKKSTSSKTMLLDFNVFLNKLEHFEFHSFSEFFRETLSDPKAVNFSPSIISITALFTPSYRNMLDIAQICRSIFPHAIIIAGGGVPTNMHKQIFQESPSFDALCYGEGEKPLSGLVGAADKLLYLEGNPSWITRKKIDEWQTFQYDFVENLDEIPFLDYDILNITDYRLNATISAYPTINDKNQNIPVMTSRGCPHSCCFCSSSTVHGKKMRFYSLARVKDDFKHLKDKYGAKTIIVQDDQFLANKKRALEILDILNEFELTAFFPNSLALYMLDRKILTALKSAGVHQLVLAIESGSNRVLREIMHKPLNLSIVKQVANDCRELGIYTDVNILIGLPGETKQDIECSRIFLKTIYANWFRINVATPLIGSEMYDICLKKNYFKGSVIDTNYKKAVVETEDFTAEYIQEMAYLLNLELNFSENSDFRLGNYEIALKGFENAIKAKSDHAIAYYYAAKCYEKLGDLKKAQQYMNIAKTAAKKPFWRKYVDMFNIPIR